MLTLSDILLTFTPDAGCYVPHLQNNEAQVSAIIETYTLTDPAPVHLVVVHNQPDGPETIFATGLEGWAAYPEQIEIVDHEAGEITLCPEVGA